MCATMHWTKSPHLRAGRLHLLTRCLTATALVGFCLASAPAWGAGIFGTLSNFDCYNTDPEPSEGFEIELEGVHSADVYNTFPSHYNIKNIVEYSNGTTFGTRILFEDYHFVDSMGVAHNSILPNLNPQSTNGHFCVNLADCEHFGFAVRTQPTATRSYWLNKLADGSYTRINPNPLSIANPTWTYVPPVVPNAPPVIQAVVQPPEPPEVQPQLPDSMWMKVYVTEMERPVSLDELMSGPGIVPQAETEIETEWELLEGGLASMAEAQVGVNAQAILRRYEFFKYTGAYDPEDHAPLSNWDGVSPPPADEFGDFIAANMVAVNLVPEPATWALLVLGMGIVGLHARRRQNGARLVK